MIRKAGDLGNVASGVTTVVIVDEVCGIVSWWSGIWPLFRLRLLHAESQGPLQYDANLDRHCICTAASAIARRHQGLLRRGACAGFSRGGGTQKGRTSLEAFTHSQLWRHLRRPWRRPKRQPCAKSPKAPAQQQSPSKSVAPARREAPRSPVRMAGSRATSTMAAIGVNGHSTRSDDDKGAIAPGAQIP